MIHTIDNQPRAEGHFYKLQLFLEQLPYARVVAAPKIPLNKIQEHGESIQRNCVAAVVKVLRDLCKGPQWSPEDHGTIQKMTSGFLDFPQATVMLPSSHEDLIHLRQEVESLGLYLKKATDKLIQLAKSGFNNVVYLEADMKFDKKKGQSWDLDQPTTSALLEHGRTIILVDQVGHEWILNTYHKEKNKIKVDQATLLTDLTVEVTEDVFGRTLSCLTVIAAIQASLALIVEAEYFYKLSLSKVNSALQKLRAFSIPPELHRLVRNQSLTGDLPSLQYDKLYKATIKEATDLIEAYEREALGFLNIIHERSKNGEVFFSKHFLAQGSSIFAPLYSACNILTEGDYGKIHVASIPEAVQVIIDGNMAAIVPPQLDSPSDEGLIAQLSESLQKCKINTEEPVSYTHLTLPTTPYV